MALALFRPLPALFARLRIRFWDAGRGNRGISSPWGAFWGTLPGSQYNVAKEVGDPALSAVVSICLNWIADNFPEPAFQVNRARRDGSVVPVPNHPLVALVGNPNEFYDGDALWAATVCSYCVSGNAYWIKARGMGGGGRPVELWHIPYWQMRPRWDGPYSFIDWYEYTVEGTSYRVERGDVVHFSDKVDMRTRLGVSRLYPVLRSIWADNEAETFTAAILKNMGIPGVLLSPKNPADIITDETRTSLKERWAADFTGDNRGMPLIPSVPLEVSKLGLSPEELALKDIRMIPVTRIHAALRVHPCVTGLDAGQGASAFDNGGQQESAERSSYQNCLLPLQKRFARIVSRQLLPDYESSPRLSCGWDYKDVPSLQEEVGTLHERARSDYEKGLLTLNEARAMIGMKAMAGGDEMGEEEADETDDGEDDPDAGGGDEGE